MRASTLIVVLAILAIARGLAAADDGGDALRAPPVVIAMPTAWIQPRFAVQLSADADHQLDSGSRVAINMARITQVDVASDDLIQVCDPCSGPTRTTSGLQLVSVGWKLGVWHDAWFRGQPALALGVRVPIGADAPGGSDAEPRAAEAYVVASRILGPVRLHAGASAWRAEHRGRAGETIATGGLRAARPMVGLEWTPRIYPRTTLTTDFQYLPELGPSAAETGSRWLFTWGVRYRAFSWSAIELGVKHRQGDGLDAAVMLRLSAVLGPRPRL